MEEKNWISLISTLKYLNKIENLTLNYNECKEDMIVHFLSTIDKGNLLILNIAHNVFSCKTVEFLNKLRSTKLKLLTLSNLDDNITKIEQSNLLVSNLFASNPMLFCIIINGFSFNRFTINDKEK